jgi:hypothetical protein
MEERDNMKKKDKRPIYAPPKAADLSDSSVSGQVPDCTPNGPSPDSQMKPNPKSSPP